MEKGLINNMPNKTLSIFLIGGEDIHLRIPIIEMLHNSNYKIIAVGSKAQKSFKNSNIKYIQYRLNRGYNFLKDISTIFELYKIIKNEKPDIVHTFDTKPNILASVAAWLAQTPKRIKTINGMGRVFSVDSKKNYFLRKIYNALQIITSKLTHFTIFQNTDDLEYFVSNKLIQENNAFHVAGSGVSVEALNLSLGSCDEISKLKNSLNINNQCVIILISRILKAKGVLDYLESATEISKLSNNVKFLLVGPIEIGPDGIKKTDIDKYKDVCDYLGFRSDVPNLIKISDVVVLPTYYKEGVPRVLIEGAALSKPLISTDVNGCRDIVVNNYNGILVPTKNPKKLSEAILTLVKNSKMRVDYGKNGRDLVIKNFSLTKVCDGWRNLYEI